MRIYNHNYITHSLFAGLALGVLVLLVDWLQAKVVWLLGGCLISALLLITVIVLLLIVSS